jgi:hypothetical protein
MRLGLDAAGSWWDAVSHSPRVSLMHLDGDLLESARGIFFKYRDKDFSFTGCTSFALMKSERLKLVLTTDRHVKQAGFHPLPDR